MLTAAQECACVAVLRKSSIIEPTHKSLAQFLQTDVSPLVACESVGYRLASGLWRARFASSLASTSFAADPNHGGPLSTGVNELLALWIESQRPVVLSSATSAIQDTCDAGSSSDLNALHGLIDPVSESISLFWFTGIRSSSETVADLLYLLVPHLHSIVCRVHRPATNPRCFTTAEVEVIEHLLAGKSNKQIARDLHKSEATVRNQLHSVFDKLHVSSRAAAISALGRTLNMAREGLEDSMTCAPPLHRISRRSVDRTTVPLKKCEADS